VESHDRKRYNVMSKKIPEKTARQAAIFKDRINLVKDNRVKLGLDTCRTTLSDIRITKALAEDPDFEVLMKRIERKPRKETLL